jgi:hypothetical protein
LVRGLNVGVSGFAIEPSGQQTVVSRLVRRRGSTTPGSKPTPAKHGVFEDTSVTTGTADIARDNGYSTWLQIAPATGVNLYAGYTRSAHFSLNTVFFGISFNLGKAIRSLGS